ncbi:MAG: hypothetical protein BMS9Abin23_0525 [Thermodesulfobacteriota bacterium]|nr:MAG: hypothetical protein BMS9Abin23_0525 [Thermodesulfobacteriota bacterium]
MTIKKKCYPFLTILFLYFFFISESALAAQLFSAEFSFDAGYRVDNLDWNIAGDASGANPNILSELAWKDLETFQLKAGTKLHILERIYVRGSFQGGLIMAGGVRDSDYLGDNRTIEFSRSDNGVDNGTLWDASAGVGVATAIPFIGGRLEIAPLIGYSYHKQNLTLTDGFQTIPLSGPFPGLNSVYRARWMGPWFGTDLSFMFEKIVFNGTFEYHLADYLGVGDWNLRSDFQHPRSFEHRADGSGVLLSASLQYLFADGWSADAGFEYQDWQTDVGVDRTYFSNGTIMDTQINEVNWNSLYVTVGVNYAF